MTLDKYDATVQMLEVFKEKGVDLSKPLNIEFVIYVPTEESALSIAKKVHPLGFSFKMHSNEETNDWTCYCTKSMIPEVSELLRVEQELANIAEPLGGDVDGFGAYLDED